jgi:hypothetical protein
MKLKLSNLLIEKLGVSVEDCRDLLVEMLAGKTPEGSGWVLLAADCVDEEHFFVRKVGVFVC